MPPGAEPALERLLPAPAQPDRRVDQADHRVGLREVAPQFAGGEVGSSENRPNALRSAEDPLEQLDRLLRRPIALSASTYQKPQIMNAVCASAEIVVGAVAQEQVAPPQGLADRLDGGAKRGSSAVAKPSSCSSSRVASRSRPPNVDVNVPVPGLLRVRVDHRMHAIRLAAPEIGAVVAADRSGDLRQPVAGGPAHHRSRRCGRPPACGAPRARHRAGRTPRWPARRASRCPNRPRCRGGSGGGRGRHASPRG